jgi:hypothetical protein
VRAGMAAAEVAVAPGPGMSMLAGIRNAPGRPAGAEARMTAARVADGLAAAEASGLQRSRGDREDDARSPSGHAERIA